MSETHDRQWQRRTVRLKYAVGDVQLFSLDLPAIVRTDDWLERLADSDLEAPPLTELPAGVQAALIRSRRVDRPLARVDRVERFIRYVPYHYERYYIELTGTFQQYLDKFSGKTRATLLRKVRRFADRSGGTIRWNEFRSPQEMDAFRALGREVSRKTYQERLHGSGLPDDDAFWERVRALALADLARGYVLLSDGRPIAYLWCPIVDGRVIYEHLGYDPTFGSWSPGTVLQYLVVERLFEERRHQYFDFTQGGGAHKKLFATSSASCADVYYFRPTWRNRVAVQLHHWLDDLSTIGGNALERIGVKARVRRWLRGQESLSEQVDLRRAAPSKV